MSQLEQSDSLTKSSVNLKNAIFGNVGSMMSYKVGAEDAEKLEKEFAPNFSAGDLVNMDKFKGVMRLMVDGQVTRAFSLIPENIYLDKGDPKLMRAYMELSSQIRSWKRIRQSWNSLQNRCSLKYFYDKKYLYFLSCLSSPLSIYAECQLVLLVLTKTTLSEIVAIAKVNSPMNVASQILVSDRNMVQTIGTLIPVSSSSSLMTWASILISPRQLDDSISMMYTRYMKKLRITSWTVLSSNQNTHSTKNSSKIIK